MTEIAAIDNYDLPRHLKKKLTLAYKESEIVNILSQKINKLKHEYDVKSFALLERKILLSIMLKVPFQYHLLRRNFTAIQVKKDQKVQVKQRVKIYQQAINKMKHIIRQDIDIFLQHKKNRDPKYYICNWINCIEYIDLAIKNLIPINLTIDQFIADTTYHQNIFQKLINLWPKGYMTINKIKLAYKFYFLDKLYFKNKAKHIKKEKDTLKSSTKDEIIKKKTDKKKKKKKIEYPIILI